MTDSQLDAFRGLPAPESCRIVDFERAEVVTLESFPPQYVLVVSGTKPASMKVELVPRIYIRQPEFWGIEVIGCLPGGIILPAFVPYTVSLSLAGITGTEGVEVIGANRAQQLAVPPREGAGYQQGSFRLSIRSKAGQVLATATLTCPPDGGSHPNSVEACRQLTEARGRIEDVPEQDGVCPQIFQPVVLAASGTWDGEERIYEQEFSNRCFGVLGTGGVIFAFGDDEAASV
jgi:hypothetical protein